MFHSTIDLYTNFAFTHPLKNHSKMFKDFFLDFHQHHPQPTKDTNRQKVKKYKQKKIIIKIFVFSSSQINYETNFVGIFLRDSIINTFG